MCHFRRKEQVTFSGQTELYFQSILSYGDCQKQWFIVTESYSRPKSWPYPLHKAAYLIFTTNWRKVAYWFAAHPTCFLLLCAQKKATSSSLSELNIAMWLSLGNGTWRKTEKHILDSAQTTLPKFFMLSHFPHWLCDGRNIQKKKEELQHGRKLVGEWEGKS